MTSSEDLAPARPGLALQHPGRLGGALLGLAAVLLLPRLLTFFQIGLSLVTWPWQFDFDEGINLHAVLELAGGHNIYRHNGPDAFISAPYPPLFYIVNAPVARLVGAQFAPGRALSLLATLAIAVLILYIAGKVMGARYAGLPGALLWLCLSPVAVWSSLYKQDMPALALGLAGLAWVISNPAGRRVYVASALFALAFYTKQSALAAAAATTLWLLVRDPKAGARFIISLVLLIPLPFVLANLLLKGGLWEHLVGNHVLPWSAGRLKQAVSRLWGEHWPLLLGTMAAFAWLLTRLVRGVGPLRSRLGSPPGLSLLYLLVGGAATLVQAGYEGANYNHLLDLLLPMCLVLSIAAGTLWGALVSPSEGRQRATSPGGLTLLGLLLIVQLFVFQDPHTWYRGGFWPSPERRNELESLSNLVASAPGDVYSEDAYLLLRNGKPVLYDDPSTFVPLAEIGRWDDSVLTRRLRDRTFGLVLLMRGSVRWTPVGLSAFEDSYALKFPGSIDTYEPLLFPASPQYTLTCALTGGGDAVTLQGYSLPPGAGAGGVAPGDTLRVALYWQAAHRLARSYASFVHLLSEAGAQVAGRDNPTTGAQQPTDAWATAATITDTTAIPLPAELQPGRYRLLAGMYRAEGGALQSLTPSCVAGEQYGDAVSLGWLEIKAP